jgi:hypothetical protein
MTQQLVEQQKIQQLDLKSNYKDILSSQMAQHEMSKYQDAQEKAEMGR